MRLTGGRSEAARCGSGFPGRFSCQEFLRSMDQTASRFAQKVLVYGPTTRGRALFVIHGEGAAAMVLKGQARRVGSNGRVKAIELTVDGADRDRRPTSSGYARQEMVNTPVGAFTVFSYGYVAACDEPLFRTPQLECMGRLVRPAYDRGEPVCVGVQR
mgnify:CR=1 FL=1